MFSILSTHACGYAIFVENDMGNTTLWNFSLFIFFSYIYEIHLFLFQYKLSPAVPLTITWEIFTRRYMCKLCFQCSQNTSVIPWQGISTYHGMNEFHFALLSKIVLNNASVRNIMGAMVLATVWQNEFLSSILPLELHLNPHTDCMSSV